MNNNNVLKRSFISTIIFIVIVLIVFYFIFKNNDYREVLNILKYSNKIYLVIAILAMASFSFCEGLTLKTLFQLLGDKVPLKDTYKYALSGFFVSSITPSSSGGDPMQLYLMNKDKIKISHATIALLVKLCTFQFVVIFLATIGFIFYHDIFFSSVGNIKYLLFLSIFLNVLVACLYFLMIFCKPVIMYIVEIISKIMKKIHVKNTDNIIEKINLQVEEYSRASIYLRKNKLVFFKVFMITLIELILYYSIPYFVYLSLGLHNYPIVTFIFMQAMLFISVSSLPLPGAVGVSEATFLNIYKTMFPANILAIIMIITRFINFYIFVLYSGIMMLIFVTKNNLKKD